MSQDDNKNLSLFNKVLKKNPKYKDHKGVTSKQEALALVKKELSDNDDEVETFFRQLSFDDKLLPFLSTLIAFPWKVATHPVSKAAGGFASHVSVSLATMFATMYLFVDSPEFKKWFEGGSNPQAIFVERFISPKTMESALIKAGVDTPTAVSIASMIRGFRAMGLHNFEIPLLRMTASVTPDLISKPLTTIADICETYFVQTGITELTRTGRAAIYHTIGEGGGLVDYVTGVDSDSSRQVSQFISVSSEKLNDVLHGYLPIDTAVNEVNTLVKKSPGFRELFGAIGQFMQRFTSLTESLSERVEEDLESVNVYLAENSLPRIASPQVLLNALGHQTVNIKTRPVNAMINQFIDTSPDFYGPTDPYAVTPFRSTAAVLATAALFYLKKIYNRVRGKNRTLIKQMINAQEKILEKKAESPENTLPEGNSNKPNDSTPPDIEEKKEPLSSPPFKMSKQKGITKKDLKTIHRYIKHRNLFDAISKTKTTEEFENLKREDPNGSSFPFATRRGAIDFRKKIFALVNHLEDEYGKESLHASLKQYYKDIRREVHDPASVEVKELPKPVKGETVQQYEVTEETAVAKEVRMPRGESAVEVKEQVNPTSGDQQRSDSSSYGGPNALLNKAPEPTPEPLQQPSPAPKPDGDKLYGGNEQGFPDLDKRIFDELDQFDLNTFGDDEIKLPFKPNPDPSESGFSEPSDSGFSDLSGSSDWLAEFKYPDAPESESSDPSDSSDNQSMISEPPPAQPQTRSHPVKIQASGNITRFEGLVATDDPDGGTVITGIMQFNAKQTEKSASSWLPNLIGSVTPQEQPSIPPQEQESQQQEMVIEEPDETVESWEAMYGSGSIPPSSHGYPSPRAPPSFNGSGQEFMYY